MSKSDRNFDGLSERFAKRVYGNIKGDIRLKILIRDLIESVPELISDKPLKILDVGGGLGQVSVELAKYNNQIVYNDISVEMLEAAKKLAIQSDVSEQIQWHAGPYQQLDTKLTDNFDIILCHAVVEWLHQPEKLIPFLNKYLKPDGFLSLCFYNPAALIFKNLLRGNFNSVDGIGLKHSPKKAAQCLTPINPSSSEQVKYWLVENNLSLLTVSGMRVFSDYTREKRGALLLPDEVIAKELQFSQLEPYKWLGRYLHFMAKSN